MPHIRLGLATPAASHTHARAYDRNPFPRLALNFSRSSSSGFFAEIKSRFVFNAAGIES